MLTAFRVAAARFRKSMALQLQHLAPSPLHSHHPSDTPSMSGHQRVAGTPNLQTGKQIRQYSASSLSALRQ